MIIKIISEIFGSLFWYEVFEIRHVCVSFCVPFLKIGIQSLYTHMRLPGSQHVLFSHQVTGKKGWKKCDIWAQAQLFNDRAGCPKQASVLCAPENPGWILDESWMWPQEDRVLTHCSGEVSDSRGQPWMPHVDTQTSITWNTSVAQCQDEWKGPFT